MLFLLKESVIFQNCVKATSASKRQNVLCPYLDILKSKNMKDKGNENVDKGNIKEMKNVVRFDWFFVKTV